MSLAKAIHKAVHDALLANSSLTPYLAGRIYDRVPGMMPTYPYINFEIETRDDSNTCSDAREVFVTLHIWSNAVGKVQAEEIGALVRQTLAPSDPTSHISIDGYQTTVSACSIELYRPSQDTLLTEGVLDFIYLVDPR